MISVPDPRGGDGRKPGAPQPDCGSARGSEPRRVRCVVRGTGHPVAMTLDFAGGVTATSLAMGRIAIRVAGVGMSPPSDRHASMFLITYQAHLRCGHETQSSSRARRRPRIDGQAAGNVVSGPPEPQFPAASSRKVSLVRNQVVRREPSTRRRCSRYFFPLFRTRTYRPSRFRVLPKGQIPSLDKARGERSWVLLHQNPRSNRPPDSGG